MAFSASNTEFRTPSIDRLETALAMYLIIAWRINRLMRLGRQLPELPADLLFETIEWQAAFILNRKKPPAKPPTLNTVVRLIAQLGGFLARKGDGEPGAKALWWGCARSIPLSAAFSSLGRWGLVCNAMD
ncbi:hypothetical protein HZU83_01825 [Sphaerotilus montanus]|uniref:Transposase Tn5 dimerisation domain-containing protein n=1 Tax=Sphaerotilus montanus TaxID=522889 RepID=A0A7Y9QU39_9BURK|nr:hypothetical protein [Sphaerotilus montanus]NZD55416.1 hypothetical protein [Sphaerotilus montanus]